MKTSIKIAVAIVAVLVTFILATPVKSQAPSETEVYNEPVKTVEAIKVELPIEPVKAVSDFPALIEKYAQEFQVSRALITELIILENGKWDETLQSYHRYATDRPEWGVKAGDRERSFGLAQIHLPSHPNITYEQATDGDFSIRFIAKAISEGRGSQWSCYRTAQYNIANGKSGGKCTQ